MNLAVDSTPAIKPPPKRTGGALEPKADPPSGSRPRWPVVMAAFTATTAALLFRWGYTFGYFDQTVLSVRGIALADRSAFPVDWFAQSVPQPHWLFDAVTFAGERLGVLTWVYLAYWLASIAVFAVAAVWLAERFLPDRPGLAVLLGPLVVLGPSKILGSSGPLVWFAIPHMLGGCLAFLAVAALLTGRWRAAAVAALVAGAVHVQHGADLAAVLLVAALMPTAWTRKQRAVLAGVAGALVIGAQVVAQARGLDTGGQAWLQACRQMIPYHCYAPTWRWPYLVSGAVVLALAGYFAWSARERWRVVVPAVLLPTAGLFLAVVAERFEWGVFGRLAQQYNLHRLAAQVVPFGALGLLVLADRWATGTGRQRLPVTARAALAGAVTMFWCSTTEEAFSRRLLDRPSLLAVGLSLVVAAVVVRGDHHRPISSPSRPTANTLATLLAVGFGLMARQGTFGPVGYDGNVPGIRAALAIGRQTPPDAVIAAPPEIFWLRLVSRRSVVADCKAGPYGGSAWEEYLRRLRALGDGCTSAGVGFKGLSVAEVEALRGRYGVTDVLLQGDDPKLAYARAHWDPVYTAPPQPFPHMGHGWALFRLPPLP